MSYVLGQYSKNKDTADSFFMTYITEGAVKEKNSGGDSGTSGKEAGFDNRCIQVTALSAGTNYYFHGLIKRMTSDQTFYIKLINYSTRSEEDDYEQFIKKITISGGDPDDWVPVEFIFTPYKTFDSILFELQRDVRDYREEVRYPVIIYEELSIINNIIPTIIQSGVKLIKIGVQSRPGLLMCINGEEIRTCRTGIYELKNSVILVTFFSVVAGAKENGTQLEVLKDSINTAWEAAEEITDLEQREAAKKAIGANQNCCLFASSKTRKIDSFTLDYMYQDE